MSHIISENSETELSSLLHSSVVANFYVKNKIKENLNELRDLALPKLLISRGILPNCLFAVVQFNYKICFIYYMQYLKSNHH